MIQRLWNAFLETITSDPDSDQATSSTETITRSDTRITIRKNTSATEEALRNQGDYEPRVTQAIHNILRPGGTGVDLGAHIGHHTLSMRQAVGPTGTVISVEPHPSRATLLKHNVAQNHYDNITVVTSPVSDTHGLHWLSDNGSPHLTTSSGYGQIVATTTIPALLHYHNITTIDLLKVDIEGHEANALEPITPATVTNLIIELHPLSLTDNETDKLNAFLRAYPSVQTLDKEPVDDIQSLSNDTTRHILLCTQ